MFVIILNQCDGEGLEKVYTLSKDSEALGIARFRVAPYKMRLFKSIQDAKAEIMLLKTFQPQLKKAKLSIFDTQNSYNVARWKLATKRK